MVYFDKYLGIATVFLGVVFNLLGVRDRGVVGSLIAVAIPYFFGATRRLGECNCLDVAGLVFGLLENNIVVAI